MSNPIELRRPYRSHANVILWVLVLPLVLAPTGGLTPTPAHHAGASAQPARVVEAYGKLPLAFEANQGQTDSQVKFLSRGAGYTLFLTSTEAVLTLGKVSRQEAGLQTGISLPMKNRPTKHEALSVLRMKLLGASAEAKVTGQDELPGKSSYFTGHDPNKWHTNVPQYTKVRYANIYPRVDLVYYGNHRELEYDFVVQPGAHPNVIRLRIEGAKNVRLEQGDLVLSSAAGDVHLRRPHVYQEVNGTRHEISGGYVLKNKNEAGFRIADYDQSRSLIIDPVLAYSTYLGGTGAERAYSVTVDSAGNAYVTGSTASTDFPTVNAMQPTNHGGDQYCNNGYYGDCDAFVSKINADGSALVYSTYLGGSGNDNGYGIAVDSAGNAYVTGMTTSSDFPTVKAIQPTNHGGGRYCNNGFDGACDAFVTKINADGSALVYSTYLGGSGNDSANSIALDSVGNVYVTGSTGSSDFPTKNAIQPTFGGCRPYPAKCEDAFVTKINAQGSALVYSTYLGGSGGESGWGIAVRSAGSAYVTGFTDSTDFPTVNAIQPTLHSGPRDCHWTPSFSVGCDCFVTRINAAGSALVYSTYLGGSDWDEAGGIAVDSTGNAYVSGQTVSTDFPTANPIQPTLHGVEDVFVTKINAAGSGLVYSTYIGGGASEAGGAIAVDPRGNAYIAGHTNSTDFPTLNAIQSTNHGWLDAFLTKINADGSTLGYSTYLGGGSADQALDVAVDSAGNAYVIGYTQSRAFFPKSLLALQQSFKGQYDAFITKIASQTFVGVSPLKLAFPAQVLGTASAQKKVTFTNSGAGTLTMNQIYVAGLNTGDFAETNNCPTMLDAGGTCSIWVTFKPSAKNTRKGVLGISDSDPASPQAIPLSGVGTVVSLSAKSLAFGKVTVGGTSFPKAVMLTNMGDSQLNFSGISVTGVNASDYSQTNTCGTSIVVGGNCTIMVTFKPTAIGSRKAAVSISDDGGASPQKIALSGTGV